MAPRDSKEMLLQRAAESAIRSIGLGYDVAADVRLKFCKQRGSSDPSLIELPGSLTTVAGVPKSIKCDKGERMRFRSDVLSFQQIFHVSEMNFGYVKRTTSG